MSAAAPALRLAEVALGGGPPGEDVRVGEPAEAPARRLLRVEEAEELAPHDVGLGRLAAVEVGLERGGPAVDKGERGRERHVAHELELGDGQPTRGRARVPDHEHERALLDPVLGALREREVVGRVERPAVVAVDAEERKIGRVAGVGKVVVVAAEVAERPLWRHHEADVPVAPEHVGRVPPAVVEPDDLDHVVVAVGVGLGDAVGPQQSGRHGGLGLGEGRLALGVGLGRVDGRRQRPGHVLDGDELVHG